MALTKRQKLALWLWWRNRRRRQTQESRSVSVLPFNKSRERHGEYHSLMPQLLENEDNFKEYLKMKRKTFQQLLERCSADLTKATTNFCKPITPAERLVVTLRFLASGDSFRSLGFRFRMGFATVRQIVRETVTVIWTKLQPLEMPFPNSEMWEDIAAYFCRQWNFPHCVGAIGGKCVQIKLRHCAGSKQVSDKESSIILVAIADGKGRFVIVDVGGYGSSGDSGILRDSTLYNMLKNDKLHLPQPTNIPDTNIVIPFVFVGDESFPLTRFLMKPFPKRDLTDDKRIFNYRLSRARCQVDSAFDMASSAWQILLKSLEVEHTFAQEILKAVCVLHNFILNNEEEECIQGSEDNVPREPTADIANSNFPPCNKRPANEAMELRAKFLSYFVSPVGSIYRCKLIKNYK